MKTWKTPGSPGEPIKVISIAEAIAKFGWEYVDRRQQEHEALVARVLPNRSSE